MHFPQPIHFSEFIVIVPIKNPLFSTALTEHTLFTGQKGDLSHLLWFMNAFLFLFELILLNEYLRIFLYYIPYRGINQVIILFIQLFLLQTDCYIIQRKILFFLIIRYEILAQLYHPHS